MTERVRPAPLTRTATTHNPRPTTHDPRPTTHDPRPTTHDPRPTTYNPQTHKPQSLQSTTRTKYRCAHHAFHHRQRTPCRGHQRGSGPSRSTLRVGLSQTKPITITHGSFRYDTNTCTHVGVSLRSRTRSQDIVGDGERLLGSRSHATLLHVHTELLQQVLGLVLVQVQEALGTRGPALPCMHHNHRRHQQSPHDHRSTTQSHTRQTHTQGTPSTPCTRQMAGRTGMEAPTARAATDATRGAPMTRLAAAAWKPRAAGRARPLAAMAPARRRVEYILTQRNVTKGGLGRGGGVDTTA